MAADNTLTGTPGLGIATTPGPSFNTPFFGAFPKVNYDINNTQKYITGPHETITDIFFRFGIIKKILNNVSAYYVYNVTDSDTPELLAERVYNDIGAGWIIIYANKIFDPQFDWPLQYDAFQKMIINKYGSIEWSQTNTHHYEMVKTRTNEFSGITNITTFVIDGEMVTLSPPSVPYVDYISIGEETNSYVIDGKTVIETTSGREVSYYDYELKLNDDKRIIKIILPQYYTQIMSEFKKITNLSPASYLRV
jgi:hypothetical protein